MGDIRTVSVVTVARSDFSILTPVLKAIQAHPALKLHLIAGGMHLAPQFGLTITEIEKAGFVVDDRVDFTLASDSGLGVATSTGLALMGFAAVFDRVRPDIALVIGDRYEMFAATSALLPLSIPVAHLHGGELTEGALDDAMRHAMTKLSHLHFTSTEDYAARVRQLGEEDWRVHVTGAPALDAIQTIPRLDADSLKARHGLTFDAPPLVVTFHPTTQNAQAVRDEAEALLVALSQANAPIVMTYPNADAQGRELLSLFQAFAARTPKVDLVANLGMEGYFSLLALAAAMVGNSSSGIIEAASFELPVVNIGDRQKGRLAGANVINAEASADGILAAITKACSPEFRRSLMGLRNTYGHGGAGQKIAELLADVKIDRTLLQKPFQDR